MGQPVYRFLERGDEKQISILHRKVMGLERNNDFWEWKYWQNPAGKPIYSVAVQDGQIFGQVGGGVLRLKVGANILTVWTMQDFLVLQEKRKGTPFFRLEKIARQESFRRKIYVHYGFSTKKAYKIYTKMLKFRNVGCIKEPTAILNLEPLLALKINSLFVRCFLSFFIQPLINIVFFFGQTKIPAGYLLREVNHFDSRFDAFWKKVKGDYEIIVVRDSKYLNWRYLKIPHLNYKIYALEKDGEIEGFVVLRISASGRKGIIEDILVSADKEGRRLAKILLSYALKYFKKKGVGGVVAWMLKNSSLSGIFRRRGFFLRPTPHNLLIRSYGEEFPINYLLNSSKWYVMMGDVDIY